MLALGAALLASLAPLPAVNVGASSITSASLGVIPLSLNAASNSCVTVKLPVLGTRKVCLGLTAG